MLAEVAKVTRGQSWGESDPCNESTGDPYFSPFFSLHFAYHIALPCHHPLFTTPGSFSLHVNHLAPNKAQG